MITYLLEDEARRLTKQIKECTSTLKRSPEGKIRSSTTRGKYVKWYHVIDGNYHTLPKSNRKLALALMKKRKAEVELQGAQKELRALTRYQKARADSLAATQKLVDSRLFQEMITAQPSVTMVKRGPIFKEEDLKFCTPRGLSVRSKSELIIANALDAHGIEYVYEDELWLDGELYQPDFMAKNKRTGKTIYWEHLGLMDKEKYRRRASNKMEIYTKNGIIPMVNFIITCETDEHPLDCILVERMIQHFLE